MQINIKSLKNVAEFKYLGMKATNQNLNHINKEV